MKIMGQRQQRFAETVRAAVSQAFLRGELNAPVRTDLLTVSDVWVSADLKIARVFLSGLGEEEREVLKLLNKSAPALRKIVGQNVHSKYTPSLKFFADKELEQTLEMQNKLYKLVEGKA